MKIGSLVLTQPFLLAPLESVSDCAFRHLCWSLGAGFTWTEMVRARGLVRNNKATLDLIDTFDAEVPTGVQLLVTDARELEATLAKIELASRTSHPHFMSLRAVDLNFGCPSPEIIKIGAGPALLKRRNPLREIFAVLKRWKARTSLPIGAVTAKIRLGLNRAELDQKIFLPLVDLANEFLDALTVHARHAREPSSAPARWEAIAEVKRRASIPIIGNGDGTSAEAARNLMRETGCDGVLIARGAIRSPWIFRELASQGSGFPTIDEIDAAEARWNQRATELESKSKYFEWHTEGFQRMRARARGEKPTTEHLPPETG